MFLKYKKIILKISFNEPVTFYTFPTFIFHSVLGKGLKRLVCLFRGRPCKTCSLRFTCAYSWLFETPIEKENAVEAYRKLMGTTDPSKAEPGTIRHAYGESVQKNAVHGSDSDENAHLEINFFFSKHERFLKGRPLSLK